MKYLQKIKFTVLFTITVIFALAILLPKTLLAQEEGSRRPIFGTEASLGIARLVDVLEEDVQDGHVVVSSEEGPTLSTIPYDGHVIGVVARDAAIIISSSDTEDGVPVVQNGQVYILVSARDGAIEKGDLLTTSTVPGVAVKANQSGYVLGSSLEDYDNSDPERVEKIAAELDLHYFNSKPTFPGTLSDIFKIALLSVDEGPDPLFKYIVAALVVIGSFILGFMTFGRTASKGVEALGRNPAAKATIHLGIIFNVAIVVIIVLTGLTVAFLILRL
jgi:F0F1-type ATP synthase membrane subunit c/vacuolar-type H+-ATPase subunit K